MIEYIFYSVLFVIGTFGADFLCSFLFESERKISQLFFEIIIFLIVSNYLLFSVYSYENFFLVGFIYLFFSFLSMVFSRVLGFLVFSRVLGKIGFAKNNYSKSSIRLASRLIDRFSKREVINYFDLAGFPRDFLEHLEKTLKE